MRSTRLWRANSETTSTKTSAFDAVGDGQRLVDAVARPLLVAQLLLDDEHHAAPAAPELAEELVALEVAGETDDGHEGNSSRESWRASAASGNSQAGRNRVNRWRTWPRCGRRHRAAGEARPAGPGRLTRARPGARRCAGRHPTAARSPRRRSAPSSWARGRRRRRRAGVSPAGVWRAANRYALARSWRWMNRTDRWQNRQSPSKMITGAIENCRIAQFQNFTSTSAAPKCWSGDILKS